MKLDNIEYAIELFEADNLRGCVTAEKLNAVFIALGGKPIAVNMSRPGAKDGSDLKLAALYIELLKARAEAVK